jgi:hypothetical protein
LCLEGGNVSYFFWFLVVSLPLQPPHCGCCLYRLRLFSESFCHLSPSYVALRKARFFYDFFRIIDETIAYRLCLCLYSLFCFGSVLVTLFSYLNRKRKRKRKRKRAMFISITLVYGLSQYFFFNI